jgi:uncharacterized protein (TIGR00266 family)
MRDTARWHLAIGGHQIGPIPEAEIRARIAAKTVDGSTLGWAPGMAQWTPLSEIPAFARDLGASDRATVPPPPTPGRRAHDIDFSIHGGEMQFVEVELDPGECAIAEAGTMIYMTQGIGMETVFGDADPASQDFVGKLLGAGRRLLSGESLFLTVYENRAQERHRVAFGAPHPGKILAMDLAALGGELLCQKSSFLCAAHGVQIGIAFQRRIGAGLFGGEGSIMQRLQGDGLAFVHAGGHVHALDLAAGETLRVDTGCLVACQPGIDFDVEYVGAIKTALFGGEGLFFATLRGPGRVWIQSLPLSRLAGRLLAAATTRKEEGSILGGIGQVLDTK